MKNINSYDLMLIVDFKELARDCPKISLKYNHFNEYKIHSFDDYCSWFSDEVIDDIKNWWDKELSDQEKEKILVDWMTEYRTNANNLLEKAYKLYSILN